MEHDFVVQLGQGVLKRESFLHFIKCVYQLSSNIHLILFIQARLPLPQVLLTGIWVSWSYFASSPLSNFRSLLAAKSTTFPAIGSATQTILNVIAEIKNHKEFCAKFGISEEELESTPESPATTAYGAYVLDVGLQGHSSRFSVPHKC